MRLTWVHRVGLLLLGALALGGAITMSVMDLGGAAAIAGVIGLILPGFLVVTFAIVGIFPNVHLKDGSIDWAKIEPTGGYLPQDEFGEQRKAITDERVRSEDALREELKTVSTRLEDYILAHEPAPDDGLTDEDRLSEMAQALVDNEEDYDHRRYHGIDRTDGVDTDQVGAWRDQARNDFRKELRRQQAQFKFGMRPKPPSRIYDEY